MRSVLTEISKMRRDWTADYIYYHHISKFVLKIPVCNTFNQFCNIKYYSLKFVNVKKKDVNQVFYFISVAYSLFTNKMSTIDSYKLISQECEVLPIYIIII